MGRSRYRIIEHDQPHFLTCTVVQWLPLFADPTLAEIILNSLSYLRNEHRILLYGYVIMEDHLHLVASGSELVKAIGNFKSFTARSIIDELILRGSEKMLSSLHQNRLKHKHDRQYQVWQEGSHPEVIHGSAMMRQKLEYIHANPVRRGYVDEAIQWWYSSARNYAGVTGLIEVDKEWV